jgi:hypothetical protein
MSSRGLRIGWVDEYIDACARYWSKATMESAERNTSGEGEGGVGATADSLVADVDEEIYLDGDAVAEIVDILRWQGQEAATDVRVVEGTVWLLATQDGNGSWPTWWGAHMVNEPTQYDMIDTNRTAVLALLEHASELSVPSTPPHENIVNALRPSCVPSAPEMELLWRAYAKHLVEVSGITDAARPGHIDEQPK